MSNQLSPALLAQLFAQESNDPFLMLITLSHPTFSDIRLVNNTEDIVSNGLTYTSFPVTIRLPVDDGETTRELNIDFDNVSLELIDEIRTVTTPINLKIEMILASNPDLVEITLEDLKLRSLTYNKQRISAKIIMDNFLNVELNAEVYGPKNFPGIF